MKLRLNSRLDAHDLSLRFARARQLQIKDFLSPPDAKELARSLADIDWRLVLNSGERHIDLSRAQVVQMGDQRLAAIVAEVDKSAASGFQYLYENYPVTDLAEAGALEHRLLKNALELMNSEPTLAFLKKVTGLEADFCDMQATRYGPGHFLTVHDDAADGKNRTFAYVLSLSEIWSPTWGGQLQVLDASKKNVVSAYSPCFNALSVFAVPVPHHVSQVATFAPTGRVSLTGWFRLRTNPS